MRRFVTLAALVLAASCAPAPAPVPPAPSLPPAAPIAPEPVPFDPCAGDTFGLAPGALDVTNGIIAKKRGTMGRASRQIVATSHRLATETALEVLRKGGNAADAFVAATLVQDVVFPGVTSTAGLAGILVYEAKTKSFTYVHGGVADPIDLAARYRAGDAAVGKQVLVPGAPAAYAELLTRFGTRKLGDLVEPAAKIATEGFEADGLYAGNVAFRRDVLARSAYGRATFFHGDRPIAKGETVKLPELAKTLRAFGKDAAYFYRGSWPRAAAELVRENGGTLGVRDFETYAVESFAPIHATYMGHDVYGAGHGGLKLLVSLQALERLRAGRPAEAPSASADALERLLRVQSASNALPFLHDRAFLARGAGTEDALRASVDAVVHYVQHPAPAPPRPHAGTHSSAVVVVDAQGNVVVGTHTIEALSWGEGLFVGGVPLSTSAPAGLDDATTAPARVRADALSNTIVMKNGKLRLALAVYGTGLHPADVQIVDAVVARGKSAEDAVLEPRVGYVSFDAEHQKLDPNVHSTDPRFSTDLLCEIKKRGLTLERSMPGYPPGIVDTGFPTLVTLGDDGLAGMTPELVSGVAAGD